MKFTISSTALYAKLTAASKVLAAKNSMPILECFLLDIKILFLTVFHFMNHGEDKRHAEAKKDACREDGGSEPEEKGSADCICGEQERADSEDGRSQGPEAAERAEDGADGQD